MLRPATPLSLIFLVAFVLLLLSTLSTPIIKAIPLATFQGWDFGVLGYCKDGDCSGFVIGYSTDGLFTGNTGEEFSLPSSTRRSLSSILIIHPIAALLTLICFGLACAAHLHGPAHSPRYLLALLIFTIPTLLCTLLAFLVDILLFVPHMKWGGWIVLVATILIIASSVVTCAMRRTLVSRKARKKRIAENADMSGANYYDNLAEQRMMADSQLPRAESPPPMSGSTAVDGNGKNAQFAAFEMKRQETMRSQDHNGLNDDRAPLNPVPFRDPSVRSASAGGGQRRPYGMEEPPPPMPPPGSVGRRSMDSNGHSRPRRSSRVDQYGNPLPPMAAGAMMAGGDLPPPGMRRRNSQESMHSNGSRGRGGYGPPPPRGGFIPGPNRGGYGPPPRGGYGPRGGFGPPRGSYGPRGGPRGRGGYMGPPRGGGYGGPGMVPMGGMAMGRGQAPPRPPPPGYANEPVYYDGPPQGLPPPVDRQGVPQQDSYAQRQPSPGPNMPIGQAVEMDERTGSPGAQPNQAYSPMDSDVAGMVGMQQDRRANKPLTNTGATNSMALDSDRGIASDPSSMYSDQTYIPPRAGWQQPQQASPSPLNTAQQPPTRTGPVSPIRGPTRHARSGSEPYHEDIDPRFAEASGPASPPPPAQNNPSFAYQAEDQHTALPNALTPGSSPMPPNFAAYHSNQRMSPNHLAPRNMSGTHDPGTSSTPPSVDSYENLHQGPEGARSPAGSEASHFTSVSQRGVNPNWRPGPPGSMQGSMMGGGGGGGNGTTASAAQRRREDVLFTGNPDFALPGMGRGGGMGRGRGGFRGRGGGGMGMGMGGAEQTPQSPTRLTPNGKSPTYLPQRRRGCYYQLHGTG